MKNLSKHIGSISMLLASGLTLTACNSASENAPAVASTTMGVALDDSVLTSKVKAALLGDEMVKSMDIKVETFKGEVMLSGFVNNKEQIERSVSVAQAVEGVQKVNNKLSLKDGAQTVGNQLDDSVITTRVKSAMLADTTMKSGEVAVVTRKGEVQLSGFVDSEQQLKHAGVVASAVDGVVKVDNHLVIKK